MYIYLSTPIDTDTYIKSVISLIKGKVSYQYIEFGEGG